MQFHHVFPCNLQDGLSFSVLQIKGSWGTEMERMYISEAGQRAHRASCLLSWSSISYASSWSQKSLDKTPLGVWSAWAPNEWWAHVTETTYKAALVELPNACRRAEGHVTALYQGSWKVTEACDFCRAGPGVWGAIDSSNDEAHWMEHGMAPQPQRAKWVRCWRLMTKLLPAPVGWLHNDRMVEQSQDLTHIEKGREKGVAWAIRQTPVWPSAPLLLDCATWNS